MRRHRSGVPSIFLGAWKAPSSPSALRSLPLGCLRSTWVILLIGLPTSGHCSCLPIRHSIPIFRSRGIKGRYSPFKEYSRTTGSTIHPSTRQPQPLSLGSTCPPSPSRSRLSSESLPAFTAISQTPSAIELHSWIILSTGPIHPPLATQVLHFVAALSPAREDVRF
ncbi:hypothetical protein NMY22_g3291 [Coprinellus aureogranulatus]|nr:hypothetical protein NMY22_g3291 [Coprinellus aureogranulatus]